MTLNLNQQRLVREIALLQQCEREFKLPAKPIVDQLVADSDRPLPDVLPLPFQWVKFQWPASRGMDYREYWRQVDRRGDYL